MRFLLQCQRLIQFVLWQGADNGMDRKCLVRLVGTYKGVDESQPTDQTS
jgi:hypothetical protein